MRGRVVKTIRLLLCVYASMHPRIQTTEYKMRKFVFLSVIFFLPFLTCAVFAQEQGGVLSSENSDPALAIMAREEIDEIHVSRAESELVIKAEITPNGQINADGRAGDRIFDGSAIYGDKAGLAFSVEYFYYAFEFLGAGVGVKYGLERNIDNFGSVSVVDAYIALKPRLKIIPEYRPNDKEAVYLIFQGGYGFFNKEITLRDVSGGIVPSKTGAAWYYAAGFGAEFNGIIFEVLFAVNELDISASEGSVVNLDAKYSMTNINIGYKFGFNVPEGGK